MALRSPGLANHTRLISLKKNLIRWQIGPEKSYKTGMYIVPYPPREGRGNFSINLGRFLSCTGGKRRKKEVKGKKGMKKQKDNTKKEEKGIKWD